MYQKIAFWTLLMLAVGYLPSQIGFNFLCMAALACPAGLLHDAAEQMLKTMSRRITWYIILLIFMGCYPMNCFLILADRIQYLMNWFERI